MSITSDIRGYADTALEQGKQVVGQAQTQFNELTGTARENVSSLTAKAGDVVSDFRTQAEKTLNLDAVKTAVEPYLAQAKQYRSTVTERAEGLYGAVRSDKRVAKAFDTAEALSTVVIDTVNDRIVKPVSSLTGRGAKPAPKSARTTKPATTRPAAKSTAKKAPAKKAPAKKAASASSTAKKTAAKKAPAKKATSES